MVIIIRRFYGGNLQLYLTWCSENSDMRTQKAFDYLIEKKEYDLNGDSVSNGNNESRNLNKKNFWSKAPTILKDAIPVDLHRNIKLGGDVYALYFSLYVSLYVLFIFLYMFSITEGLYFSLYVSLYCSLYFSFSFIA